MWGDLSAKLEESDDKGSDDKGSDEAKNILDLYLVSSWSCITKVSLRSKTFWLSNKAPVPIHASLLRPLCRYVMMQ